MALGLQAYAHTGATGLVKERMQGMEAIAAATRQVGQMLKNPTGYDAVSVEESARIIQAHAGQNMTALFPEGSLEPPTEARPEIWTDWATFEEYAKDLQKQASSLEIEAEQGPDIARPRFGKLAASCKSCHEQFRAKHN
ncbi:cytochrome c [Roseibium sp. RKSG952]|uniref:c-type cytochrome n=1 Tax=Roseibium sp. RKSG952 TaxID=2529384 RepID=UPI0018AD24D9